jgi:murein DD-endopeptidase MepM/ murein hydrolase activator NlpD
VRSSLPAALVISLATGLLPVPLTVTGAHAVPAGSGPPAAAAPGRPPDGSHGRAGHGGHADDRYGWPLPGSPAVVHGFDPPPHRFGRGHRGVDLAGGAGMPVLAAAAGTVLFAGPVAGRPVVSIRHDGGLRTTYEPVLPVVSPGDRVTSGQRIGTLQPGHPECAAVACLHWGLLRDDEYLDPLQLLSPGPLRLLPWNGRRS